MFKSILCVCAAASISVAHYYVLWLPIRFELMFLLISIPTIYAVVKYHYRKEIIAPEYGKMRLLVINFLDIVSVGLIIIYILLALLTILIRILFSLEFVW